MGSKLKDLSQLRRSFRNVPNYSSAGQTFDANHMDKFLTQKDFAQPSPQKEYA